MSAQIYGVKNPLDPIDNLRAAGIRHFRSLMDRIVNDISLALAANTRGTNSVRRGMKVPKPMPLRIKYVNDIMLLYRGAGCSESVKRLYRKIDAEGDILIYSK